MAATGTVIRDAASGDAEALAGLAAGLAASFPFSRAAFDAAFGAVRSAGGTCLLVAEQGGELRGYLLGFDQVTFFANGQWPGSRNSWSKTAIAGRESAAR